MTAPLVSVILPVFNGSRYLRQAIDSVLAQTLAEFELLVIDDGSSDDSAQIAMSYSDPRIRVIRKENEGLSSTLNLGVSMARTELIARMDCDDISKHGRLEKQFRFLSRNPEVVAVGTAATVIDAEGSRICEISRPQSDASLRSLLPRTPFIHPTVMFRRSAFEKAGGYPIFMRHGGEDAVLFGRMAMVGKLANLPDPLLLYRIHPGAVSRKPKRLFKKMEIIIEQAISIGRVDQRLLSELDRLAARQSKKENEYLYHLTLAKYYLLNGSRVSAMAQTAKCLSMKPIGADAWKVFIACALPMAVVSSRWKTE